MDYELELVSITLCMTCGVGIDLLVNNMYCLDCLKRQQFLCIFNESTGYNFSSYYGKHLLEKYLGYYIDEDNFIIFMKKNGFKYNETKGLFRTKINKKKALEILGENIFWT
jgi:hypothetical protein